MYNGVELLRPRICEHPTFSIHFFHLSSFFRRLLKPRVPRFLSTMNRLPGVSPTLWNVIEPLSNLIFFEGARGI